MKKIIRIILIFVLFALSVFIVGVFFKSEVISLYNNFANRILDFKKTEIGNLLSQTGKEIFSPPPLSVQKSEQQVALTKDKVIIATNLQRKNNNLPILSENIKLNEAALAKAKDMFNKQYFEHVSPSGIGPSELAQEHGYEYIIIGENLIMGNFSSETELVQAWMDSPGHRANILNARYAEIGVAAIKGIYDGQTVWIAVQGFGLPLSECQQPDADLKAKIESYKSQLDSFAAEIETRRAEIDSLKPNFKRNDLIDIYNSLVERYNLLAETVENLISQYNAQVNSFNKCVSGQ